MPTDATREESAGKVLDLRTVFGIVARVTTPAETTGGEYVEMDITADPDARTAIHVHPEMEERYEVLSGRLDVLLDDSWQTLEAGDSLTVPRGRVHAFRNATNQPTRFMNRHTPALGFQDHLETIDRLVREGKVRGVKDPRSLIYMSLSATRYRPDRLVKPPQRVIEVIAWIGRRLGFSLD